MGFVQHTEQPSIQEEPAACNTLTCWVQDFQCCMGTGKDPLPAPTPLPPSASTACRRWPCRCCAAAARACACRRTAFQCCWWCFSRSGTSGRVPSPQPAAAAAPACEPAPAACAAAVKGGSCGGGCCTTAAASSESGGNGGSLEVGSACTHSSKAGQAGVAGRHLGMLLPGSHLQDVVDMHSPGLRSLARCTVSMRCCSPK